MPVIIFITQVGDSLLLHFLSWWMRYAREPSQMLNLPWNDGRVAVNPN
jgi:hypothetical protein